MDYPKLRNINIFPIQNSGQTLLCLQDPLNISEKAIFLTPPLFFIVSLFDGHHSRLDIQAEYMRRFGELLYTEKLQEIISQLDENLFLEGERFQKVLKQKEVEFQRSSVREAVFAGRSYDADPDRLRDQLRGYFERSDGPGPLRDKQPERGLKGIIAPHIDFQRGGFCYAHAYRQVWERSSAKSFVILGTAHHPMENLYCLTRKSFITPLGTLNVDQELADALQSHYAYDLFQDEIVHRGEHTVEFQCLFLRYLYPEPFPLRIVPILCGSYQEAIENHLSPMEISPIRQFVEALRDAITSYKEEVCFIASADLAHMGLQFGDPQGINEYGLRVLSREDQEMLGYVEKIDGEGFFSSILEERDRRRICGLPPIYTMLKVLNANEGRLLKYGQAFTQETQSVVTFASLAFY